MKVIYKSGKTIQFGGLYYGDVFLYKDIAYMKIRNCERDDEDNLGVELETGDASSFYPDTLVQECFGEFKISY